MAKNIPFFLGCLLGTEATNPKAVHPYDAAMGLWNLALDADTRADIEGAGDVIQVVVDLVMKGTAGEAMTPCIGMLEPLAMSDNEETKATIQKSVTTLIGRYDTYAQEHSASETKSIFGVLSSLSRNRRAAALMIADRMLKPSMLRGLINWVEKEIQASNVNFMAALSTCPELHPRLLVHLNMDLALKIMAEQGNKRAAHAALDYMGELAKNGDYTAEVYKHLCSPKGVASIEWLAKVGTETNRSRTAEIMWGMVKEPAKVKLFRKTVPSLVPLMSSEEQQVVEVVTATVWFMAYDDAVCMSLGSSGAIPPLVKHASSKLDKIRLQATGILRNMAQHQTLLRMMEEKGCPSYLINAWKPIDVKADLTPTNVKPKFPAISLNMI